MKHSENVKRPVMFQKIVLFPLTMCLLTTPLWAQEKSDTTSTSTEQHLAPVEVRSLRASSNAPFARTEISGKELQERNLGADLPYLVQFTPSVVATSDAGAGVGYTGIRIRGTDAYRINVTLNGIPVNDAESQAAVFVDFPDIASSTGSIQIQRGVGTSTNGSGAFGATLSVSNLEQMNKAGAEFQASAGSFNTQKYSLKAGTGLLKGGWKFDLRLSKITSDGYVDRSSSDLKSLQLTSSWQINPRSALRFMLMTGVEKTDQAWNGVPEDSLASNRRYNELGRKPDGSYYANQTDNYQQDYYQLFFNHQFSNNLIANVAAFLTRGKGYYEEYKTAAKFSKYGLPPFSLGGDTLLKTDLVRQLWLDNYFYGTVFSLGYQKGGTLLTAGGGYTLYDGDHYGFIKWAEYGIPSDYRWYLNDAHKKDFSLYAKAQQKLGDFYLFGDLQWRNVFYDLNGFRDNPNVKPTVNYNFFNPKAGITYLIQESSSKKQKAYASLAVANKEPNRKDFEASPDALPKPETLYDVEAGYEISRPMWRAAFNLYYMDYRNQLVLTGQINDVGAYTRTNVAKSFRSGVEIMAAGQLRPWLRLDANATLSKNKIKDFREYLDNYDDGTQTAVSYGLTDIAFSPSIVASGILTFEPFKNLEKWNSLSIQVLNKYVGKQYLDNTGSEDRKLPAYDLTDVVLHFPLHLPPFKETQITLALNNIFNKKYESNGYTYSYLLSNNRVTENYYFPQAGFNWLLGLRLKW